jgi:hypothetical protein
MSEKRPVETKIVKTDFDLLMDLIGAIAPAYIMSDPDQEWSVEDIASMAVDQAQAIQLELKRRKKNERENQTGHNKPAEPRPETSMPGIGTRVDRQRVRRGVEG